jgi:hypothetical protein
VPCVSAMPNVKSTRTAAIVRIFIVALSLRLLVN